MRKFLFIILSLTVIFNIAAQTTEQEEYKDSDPYIIFMPDSIEFKDETAALRLLKDLSDQFKRLDSTKVQIHIHGYAARYENPMDPVWLSTERAKKVSEILLKNHGVSREIFVIYNNTPYTGKGDTDRWGSNITDEDRSSNRRVYIKIVDIEPVQELDDDDEIIIVNSVIQGSRDKEKRVGFAIPWCKVFIVLFIIGAILLILGFIIGLHFSIIGYLLMLISAILSKVICGNNVLLIILGIITLIGLIIIGLRGVSFSGGGGSGGGGENTSRIRSRSTTRSNGVRLGNTSEKPNLTQDSVAENINNDNIEQQETDTSNINYQLKNIPRIIGDHSVIDDCGSTNPNYNIVDDSSPYNNNCQRCAPTYEARRRGYNVEAKPIPLNDDLGYSNTYTSMYNNASPIRCTGNGYNDIINLMKSWGDGARAQIKVIWKGSWTGHTFNAEVVNGNINFIDPQTGDSNCADYFDNVEEGNVEVFRTDNLSFTNRIHDCLKEA